MAADWDILGIGTVAVDDLVLLDRFPAPDTKMQARSIQREGGGQTATALVTAARHGARVAFLSRLGEDALSHFSIHLLKEEGVDCSLVQTQPGSQPFHSVILVDTHSGSRTILYDRHGVEEPDAQAVDAALVARSRVVFIDQNVPRAGLRAARLASAAGIPVVADLELKDIPGLDELLSYISHLVIGMEFAARLTGLNDPADMARALANPRRAACVVTAGSEGCWYVERDGPVIHQPAFTVQVIDTTGCGDVFHGAYAAAIARAESVRQAVRIASATAALKATRPGGRAGIPMLEQVLNYLEEQEMH